MTVSSRQRKRRFHQSRNHRAKDRMITNGREIVTGRGTRGILGPRRNLRRRSRGQGAERGTETEIGESVNAADRRNLTHRRIRIRIETGIVTGETTEKGREKEKESEIEIGEENVIEIDIKTLRVQSIFFE